MKQMAVVFTSTSQLQFHIYHACHILNISMHVKDGNMVVPLTFHLLRNIKILFMLQCNTTSSTYNNKKEVLIYFSSKYKTYNHFTAFTNHYAHITKHDPSSLQGAPIMALL